MSEVKSHPKMLKLCWVNLRQRCNNPNVANWEDYGGRGITYDPRWDEWSEFRADMGPHPGPGFSIDRRNNDGPYNKENCFWATRKKQNNNRRVRQLRTTPRCDSKTGVLGVRPHKEGFIVEGSEKGKPVYLGWTKDIEQAKQWRKAWEASYNEKRLASLNKTD